MIIPFLVILFSSSAVSIPLKPTTDIKTLGFYFSAETQQCSTLVEEWMGQGRIIYQTLEEK